MKKLLTGNEAIAQGAYEAGVHFASAYPGTPSTEIMETLSKHKEINSEWAPNEKVAMEAVIGASIAGARCLASMKQVGVNVAADPLLSFSYMGVNGGLVLISADEPGQHSSQTEQDNRYYAKFAKIVLLEPSDSQECKDMMKLAYDICEKFDIMVMVRMTTRICHSKSIVDIGERENVAIKPYVKNINKFLTLPEYSRKLRINLEHKLKVLKEYSETMPYNKIETTDGASIGVVASGAAYQYAREVFGDTASYLKLGMQHPMPTKLLDEFCSGYSDLYVIEENEPFIEEEIRKLGYNPKGYDFFPFSGEQTPDVLRKSIYGTSHQTIDFNKDLVVPRPPSFCAGCPHRGVFYELGKLKDVVVAGDIGCYTLGFAEPYNSMDWNVCMGASFSTGHGAQKVFSMQPGCKKRAIGILGDSTFFHTGINSLLEIVYNGSKAISIILDNRITGMTGHQENPGSGYNIMGGESNITDIEALVRACGIKHLFKVNPNDLKAVRKALADAISLDEPSVILTRWPCALKKFSAADKEEFKAMFSTKCEVVTHKCTGCKLCLKCGCPAMKLDEETKKVTIDKSMCVGCGVCSQICGVNAIVEEV